MTAYRRQLLVANIACLALTSGIIGTFSMWTGRLQSTGFWVGILAAVPWVWWYTGLLPSPWSRND